MPTPGLLLAATLTLVPSNLHAQKEAVWVNVVIEREAVMQFVPAADRAGSRSRGVCSKVRETTARTSDGLPIRGLEFTGWKQGDSYRVLVFAIVPGQAGAGTRGVCSDGSGYRLVEFDDLRIKAGEELAIRKMKDAGMKPWVLRAGPKEPL